MASGAKTNLKQLIDLRYRAGELNLFARNKAQSQLAGSVKTSFRGRGIDFEEIRHYQPGDDIRSIDWRVTARTGEAHTKLYQEERERPVLVVADQRPSMIFGTQCCFKSVQAAEVASLLCWASLGQNDRIGGLVFNGQQHQEVRPARSKSSVLKLLNAIHKYNTDEQNSHYNNDNANVDAANINEVIKELRRIAKPGSALFIISDFIGLNDDGIKQLHLLKKHCDVTAIFISDPMEKQLPARGGYQFTDGVKRQWFNTDNQQLVAAFKQRFTERSTHLTQQLAAHGIPTLAISTHNDALTVLRSQYRSQQKKKSTASNINDNVNDYVNKNMNGNNKLKAKGGPA
jgi:uncharacterized protein (DUF58 family)